MYIVEISSSNIPKQN